MDRMLLYDEAFVEMLMSSQNKMQCCVSEKPVVFESATAAGQQLTQYILSVPSTRYTHLGSSQTHVIFQIRTTWAGNRIGTLTLTECWGQV